MPWLNVPNAIREYALLVLMMSREQPSAPACGTRLDQPRLVAWRRAVRGGQFELHVSLGEIGVFFCRVANLTGEVRA